MNILHKQMKEKKKNKDMYYGKKKEKYNQIKKYLIKNKIILL